MAADVAWGCVGEHAAIWRGTRGNVGVYGDWARRDNVVADHYSCRVVLFDFAKAMADAGEKMAAARKEREEEGPTGTTAQNNVNVNGPINISMKFDKDVSPDRIAIGVVDELDKLRRRSVVLRPNAGY
mgnify:CR=1 FL=1